MTHFSLRWKAWWVRERKSPHGGETSGAAPCEPAEINKSNATCDYWILVLSGSAFQHHEKFSEGNAGTLTNGLETEDEKYEVLKDISLTPKFLSERRLGSLTACKQRNTNINGLLCNTVIVTKIQRFASECSWSSQQSLNIPMKSDMGTKISQVFLQVTHVSAHGNLVQAKDTDCMDQKGPWDPSLLEEVMAVGEGGLHSFGDTSPAGSLVPQWCSQIHVLMGSTNRTWSY